MTIALDDVTATPMATTTPKVAPTLTPNNSRPGKSLQVKATLNALKDRVGELETELHASRSHAVNAPPPALVVEGSPRGTEGSDDSAVVFAVDALHQVHTGQLLEKGREVDQLRALNDQLEATLSDVKHTWGEERASASIAAVERMDDMNQKRAGLEVRGKSNRIEQGMGISGIFRG